jgi:membrane protease subunit HflK
MERILGGAEKLVYDTGGNGQGGVVPYLPLNDLTARRPAPAASAQPQTQQSGATR